MNTDKMMKVAEHSSAEKNKLLAQDLPDLLNSDRAVYQKQIIYMKKGAFP